MSALKKKLLIAGGGYADIPLIEAGKALGFHVITSGSRADDLGHRYSDECHLEDFSNERAMLRLAESLRVDAICACCNDFSALTAAYVAEKMGLPGHDPYETAQIIHHKDRYRQFAFEHDIPSPKASGYQSVEEALSEIEQFRLPLIVKPVDLTGGKGISTVRKSEDAKAALELAFDRSRAKRVVVEEFIDGTRHGLSAFVRDGKVVFHFNDNEHYYLNPYLVSAASTPGDTPPEAVKILCQSAEKIVSLLQLKTGIFHIQYILRGGEPFIIEICRRAPGDLYTRFVQHATGVDYPAYIVRSAAGMDCSDLNQALPRGYFTRHCVMTSRNGTVKDVHVDSSVQANLIDQFMWWKNGDKIDDYLTQKLGIVFLRFDTQAEMLEKTANMQDLIRAELV
jgi:biotin carboxylase